MNEDPNTESPEIAPTKSWSSTSGTGNGERGKSDEAVDDMIAAHLKSTIENSIEQVSSATEHLKPLILEIKRSSGEITERLHRSRKQALQRNDELEAERQKIQRAACQTINALNDAMEVEEEVKKKWAIKAGISSTV